MLTIVTANVGGSQPKTTYQITVSFIEEFLKKITEKYGKTNCIVGMQEVHRAKDMNDTLQKIKDAANKLGYDVFSHNILDEEVVPPLDESNLFPNFTLMGGWKRVGKTTKKLTEKEIKGKYSIRVNENELEQLTFCSKNLKCTLVDEPKFVLNRSVGVRIEYDDKIVYVYNVHLPRGSSANLSYYKLPLKLYDSTGSEDDEFVYGGDKNVHFLERYRHTHEFFKDAVERKLEDKKPVYIFFAGDFNIDISKRKISVPKMTLYDKMEVDDATKRVNEIKGAKEIKAWVDYNDVIKDYKITEVTYVDINGKKKKSKSPATTDKNNKYDFIIYPKHLKDVEMTTILLVDEDGKSMLHKYEKELPHLNGNLHKPLVAQVKL